MTHRAFLAAAAAACGLLGILSIATPSRADDPATLLAKHKAYMGWTFGDGTLKSSRSTVEAEPSAAAATPKPGATPDPLGRANVKQIELRRELLYRSTQSRFGLAEGEEGFTGSVFWRSNINGQTVTIRARAARFAITSDLISAEALAETPATARPDEQFDGKNAAVLRIDPKTGVPAHLYFDRETGALLGATLQPEVPLEKQTLHIVSYAEFAPGKRYVSGWREGESKRTIRVTKFEPNVPVTDADLHPPTPRATWTFGEPRSIPISVAEHGNGYTNSGARAVHVQATVNGKTGTFLLDSGAGEILIFDAIAKAAGVKELARTAYSGVSGGTVSATFASVDTFTIGGSTLHNVIVAHGPQDNNELAGIIGFDALAGAVFEVDLIKQRLTVSDPAGFNIEPPPGAWAFTPDLTTFHIGVPVKVGPAVLGNVWLDTGNDLFVILPHDLESKTVALPNEVVLRDGRSFEDKKYFGGVDGTGALPARCVRLNEVQIGPYRYQKALSCFAPNDAFGLDGGLIGFDFLRHFNWVFDYPHNRVVLTPNGQ